MCIFLWLPDRTEDRSGLVGKIITFWQRIGSRVFERGGNDGFGGFLRLNSILEKNSKTSFRDQWDRSLQTERTGPLRYTLDHFVTLGCTDGPVCTNCRKPFGPVHFSSYEDRSDRSLRTVVNRSDRFTLAHFSTLYSIRFKVC